MGVMCNRFVVWSAELREQSHEVPVDAGATSLSPPETALWKAKKYILFDLRFGSSGHCPGTLFTADKSCLLHGKSNDSPISEALFSHAPSSHSLWGRNQGNVMAWLHVSRVK